MITQKEKQGAGEAEADREEALRKAGGDEAAMQNAVDGKLPVADSTAGEEDVTNGDTNVSEEEKQGLEDAAERMPEEDDDIADFEMLDDTDFEGEPLDEKTDALGTDLDIEEEDMDANEYDDNE